MNKPNISEKDGRRVSYVIHGNHNEIKINVEEAIVRDICENIFLDVFYEKLMRKMEENNEMVRRMENLLNNLGK